MNTRIKKVLIIATPIVILICSFIFISIYLFNPPKNNIYPKDFIIEEGMSLKQAILVLEKENLIKSKIAAQILIMLQEDDPIVVSGLYRVKEEKNLLEIIQKINIGDFGLDSETIRIPEGATLEQIKTIISESMENITVSEINNSIIENNIKEGYLFPDTYIFLETADADLVVKTLQKNFNEKIRTLDIKKEYLEDIIIMASIIEKEASATSKQEVGDILWNRIDIGMALQVDATFVYSIGKSTFDLSYDDLEDSDNPYNTYTHRGFPPTAIGNPGLESIKAAANPNETDYLYFLTGKDGEMYYAKNFEQHKVNKFKYLK